MRTIHQNCRTAQLILASKLQNLVLIFGPYFGETTVISTKIRAMAQQLAVKTSPTADLHHVDVIAHTTPITATNSLNCRQ